MDKTSIALLQSIERSLHLIYKNIFSIKQYQFPQERITPYFATVFSPTAAAIHLPRRRTRFVNLLLAWRRVNMARRANMALLNFVLISLLYWGLKWNFLLEWSSKTSIDGGCVFSTTNLTGSSRFSRKFSIQPYTGSRANGATTIEFKLPKRDKYFKSKTSYYPNSASTFSIQRLLLSGDIELNPGMPTNDCNKSSRPRGRRETTGNIKIAHLNIRSLKNREHLILAKETVISNKIDIFTISESWLDSSVSDAEVEFPGHILHRLDRVNKHGGGVCAFVRQEYRAERLSDISYISFG